MSPRPKRTEVADVAPGMVPRESDYVEVGPVSTVNADGPAPAAAKTAAPGRDADREPVRPDVEPPEDAEWTEERPVRKS
jgi:HemY protein